jgi:hypothetical protein
MHVLAKAQYFLNKLTVFKINKGEGNKKELV